jgi:hypothetical protein
MKILIALSAMICILSCQKSALETDEFNGLPPDVNAYSITAFVAANVDSLSIMSDPLFNRAYTDPPYSKEWNTEWTCNEKPIDAPDPKILRSNQRNMSVTGLAKGRYVFQATYSTKAGKKSATLPIVAIPDIPTGTVIERTDLTWDVGQDFAFGDGTPMASASWEYDPDHIFFRGLSRFPKVEYMDPTTNTWTQVAMVYNLDQSHPKNYVYFSLHGASLFFTFSEGIGTAWSSAHPKVRLIY